MAEGYTNQIIMAAIALLIGAILIGVIATEGYAKTSLTTASREAIDISESKLEGNNINETVTYTIAKAPTGWKLGTTDCEVAGLRLGNSSTDFTETTDYAISTAGVLSLVNTTASVGSLENTTYVDYNYCADDYLNSSWGRSVMNMVGGFFALLLLGFAVGVFYKVFNK